MKHFIFFIVAVFLGLFIAVLNRHEQSGTEPIQARPLLRIFASSSFTAAWGPGPKLKEIFETSCQCQVDYIEGSDAGILLQRLKIEGESLGADLIIGLDQFAIDRAMKDLQWQKLNTQGLDIEPEFKDLALNNFFLPYDYGVLGFMARKENNSLATVKELNDLFLPQLTAKIALQDPRTSTPGFQFLWWVIQNKGEEGGIQFMKRLMKQAHSFSASWSQSLSFYNRRAVDLVFSYSTSPLYYQIEEKNNSHVVIPFKEAPPVQVEFMGIPEVCRSCELAEKFVNLMLSKEGQKILMEKNYMLPIVNNVKQGTPFASANRLGPLPKVNIPTQEEVDKVLSLWAEIRQGSEN